MKVVKFGGTSVADAKQILKIVNIVTSDSARRIVVVSAPGKRHSKDTKVTDLLIALANAVIAGQPFENELAAVVQRFAEIQQELSLDSEPASTRTRQTPGETSLQLADRIKSGAPHLSRRSSGSNSIPHLPESAASLNHAAPRPWKPGAICKSYVPAPTLTPRIVPCVKGGGS